MSACSTIAHTAAAATLRDAGFSVEHPPEDWLFTATLDCTERRDVPAIAIDRADDPDALLSSAIRRGSPAIGRREFVGHGRSANPQVFLDPFDLIG